MVTFPTHIDAHPQHPSALGFRAVVRTVMRHQPQQYGLAYVLRIVHVAKPSIADAHNPVGIGMHQKFNPVSRLHLLTPFHLSNEIALRIPSSVHKKRTQLFALRPNLIFTVRLPAERS